MDLDKFTFIAREDFKSVWFWGNFAFVFLTGIFFNMWWTVFLAVGFNMLRDKLKFWNDTESVLQSTAGYLSGFMGYLVISILRAIL